MSLHRLNRFGGCLLRLGVACLMVLSFMLPSCLPGKGSAAESDVQTIFSRVQAYDFHPLNEEQTFTIDRTLNKHGIADLDDSDGRVRLLAIGDLTRLLPQDAIAVVQGLADVDPHVRQIAAAALGIARETTAIAALERIVQHDAHPLVRSQAAMSLGQMESQQSLNLLRSVRENDTSRDVRHQCQLAVDQIEKKAGATKELLAAFRNLDPQVFETVRVGDAAPDFALVDIEGVTRRLSDFGNKKWVVLIWVFADWCPVCHGEFHELIELQEEFERAGVQVATLECHDTYRCRVMVGQELEPEYWFSKTSFKEAYTEGIWWPHLSDPAGAVGAKYGVDPMCFAVHAEYINRPSTVIIDPGGAVRFAYYGTFWGDRPSIRQTLEMIEEEDFTFEHPRRLQVGR